MTVQDTISLAMSLTNFIKEFCLMLGHFHNNNNLCPVWRAVFTAPLSLFTVPLRYSHHLDKAPCSMISILLLQVCGGRENWTPRNPIATLLVKLFKSGWNLHHLSLDPSRNKTCSCSVFFMTYIPSLTWKPLVLTGAIETVMQSTHSSCVVKNR